jgi:general stress protein 26
MTDSITDSRADRDTLWQLIKGIRFGMFTTVHPNGHLHAHPMTTQNKSLGEDDTLWFFMSRRSHPVNDLSACSQVNIAYADTGDDVYVSVTGHARVVDDPAQVRALWSKMTEAWFPGGPDDPDVALVAVTVAHAHYWNIKENKLTQLFKMAKAAITGDRPSVGESGEVRLN